MKRSPNRSRPTALCTRAVVIALLSLLGALLVGGVVAPAVQAAPATPGGCGVSIAEENQFQAEATAVEQQIATHNAQQGAIDNTNAGAVSAYNAEAAELNSRAAALKAKGAEIQGKAGTCSLAPKTQPKQANSPPEASISAPTSQGAPGSRPGQPQARVQEQAAPQPQANRPSSAPVQGATPPKQTTTPPKQASAPPVEDRLADPSYRSENYIEKSDGTIARRNANGIDRYGDPVPAVRRDPEDPDRYVPADSKPTIPYKSAGSNTTAVSPQESATLKATTDARTSAIDSVAKAKAMPEGPAKDAALKTAYTNQRDAGEKFGHQVGRKAIDEQFPPDKYTVDPLTPDELPGKPDTFDQVFSVTPKDGGPTRIVINETKAPRSDIGTRTIDGVRYQQGTRKYVEDILIPLRDSDAGLAKLIKDALAQGRLDYQMVRATVNADGSWKGYSVTRFGIEP